MNAYYVFLKFAKLWEAQNEVQGSRFSVQGSVQASRCRVQNPERGHQEHLNHEP
jgi:hypothetical protein